jgi:hypothetical protein
MDKNKNSQMVDLQLFPCISYFKLLSHLTYVELNLYDRFRKSSFHNRYVIAGANGLVNLTIPIAGGREQKKAIKEIEIDVTTDWQIKHWRTILSAYSKSPFFDYYSYEVREMVFNPEKKLVGFNIFILEGICKLLNLNVLFQELLDSKEQEEDNDTYNISPKNFQEDTLGPVPKYAQVFEDKIGFQPNLSILDMLFCSGPESRTLLEKL